MSIRRSHEIRKLTAKLRRAYRPWPGRVGDGNGTIEVPGHPNLWYVRPEGHNIAIPVIRGGAPREEGYPIWVGQDVYNKRWIRILGVDVERAANGGFTISEIGPHSDTHYHTGSDPVYIATRQIVELLLTVVSGMTVRIAGGFVIVGGQPAYVNGQNLSLTSYIPVSGALWGIIRANASGVLSVQEGAGVDSFADLTRDNVPEIEAGYAGLWAVKLYAGQTAVNGSVTGADFYDLRFAPMDAGGGGTISLDTTNFNGNLSAADDTVQEAFDTLDDLVFSYGAEVATTDVSNPPTEAQLITAFGTPDAFADAQKIGVLNDAASGTRAYCILSDGGHYWAIPLAKATGTTLSVSVASSSTIAEAAGQWFGRSYVRRRADGVLILVYREGSGHNTNDAELHIRFSDDNGATWSDEDKTLADVSVTNFPMNPPSGNISYGEGVIRIAPDGTLIVHMWSIDGIFPTGTLQGTYQSTSSDGGATWTTPAAVTIISNPSNDTDTFITDDDFVYNGVIYAGARIYYQQDADPSASILIKSDDNGTTWEYVSIVCAQSEGGTGGQEFGFEYIGNSTIIAMIRDNPHTHSYKRVSSDMGATWGTLTDVTSTVGIAARQRVYTRAHLKGYANWWNDSVLIMVGFVHQTSGSSTPRRNAIWISQDRGATWSGPQYIDTSTEDAGYGDIWYDATNNLWRVVNYYGTQAEADLRQYNLEITGL